MRERDLDLIAALVEGRLEDETEARALIDSSAPHREEYELQKLAYETLSTIPTASMTAHEKAALHRDVWTELQNPAEARQSSTPWYFRWSYAAAGVFVLVGLAGLVTQLTQNGDDSAAGDATRITSEAASVQDDSASDSTQAAGDGADGGESALSPTEPLLSFFAAKSDELRRQAAAESDESDTTGTLEAAHRSCLESLGLDDYSPIRELEVEETEEAGLDSSVHYLLAIAKNGDIVDDTPVALVDSVNCVLVHLDE